VEAEFHQGVRVLETARIAHVQHVVYSSLDDCTQLSGGKFPVPHYDAKAAVEHLIDRNRSSEFMQKQSDGFYSRHVSVLVTATYFENLIDNFRPEKGKLSDGRDGFIFRIPAADKPYPMIALDDIAWFATHLFENSETWGGRTLKIIGDGPTMYEVAATFERLTGIPAEYQPLDLDALRQTAKAGHTVANKFLFTQEFGFIRDYEELRRIHPALMTFENWLNKTGWRGEPGKVQKGHVVIGSKGSYQP
jgi:nucleoside-diphosphate-sugar epimerase